MKIRLCDLPCYQERKVKKDSLAHRIRNSAFDLYRLPTEGLRLDFYHYVMYRGAERTVLSMRSELSYFNELADFLSARFPKMDRLNEISEESLVKEMKKWLINQGKNIAVKNVSHRKGVYGSRERTSISYLRRAYQFFQLPDLRPIEEQDVWKLDDLGIQLRENPIKRTDTINFTAITQEKLRQQLKQVIFIELQSKALGTVRAEMAAMNRLGEFLNDRFPKVGSFLDLSREVIEEYLIYLNTEDGDRESYRTDFYHLKMVFETAEKVLENPMLGQLFLYSDAPREVKKVFRAYSDAELSRLNKAIIEGDVQVARAWMLHQMLGTRISETLTLRKDSILEHDGRYFLQIYQIKTKHLYHKPINEDVLRIIEAAIAYTKEHFPDSPYIFANERDPSRPMAYSKIQYHLMALIHENDLRDDQGELFGVGTHLIRHTYGQKLTEMHMDDVTIAKLLGHKGLSSVRHYRKMSNQKLAEETKKLREGMDDILKDIMQGW